MGKGYAEGSAVEERQAALERGDRDEVPRSLRRAVYGSTAERPERHLLGWADEIDVEELFSSGKAWGLTVSPRASVAP